MNKDDLKDLVRHLKPFYEVVRVYNDQGKTCFHAVDQEKTMFLSGSFKKYYNQLDSASVGVNRMPTLMGMLNFGLFNEVGSSYDLISETKHGVDQLSEITFKSPNGHVSTYRFMGSKVVDSQVKVPPFKGAKWDVSFTPTLKMVSELSHFLSILGGNDCVFTAKTKGGKLEFHIGSTGNDRAVIPVCDTLGVLTKDWSWPLAKVISILKLCDNEICRVKLSSQAAMSIELESDVAMYEFILPARR